MIDLLAVVRLFSGEPFVVWFMSKNMAVIQGGAFFFGLVIYMKMLNVTELLMTKSR
jgi:hypothetical protein